jgi:hypothetical protein
MSDHLSALQVFVYGSVIGLPLTTLLLVILIMRRLRVRGQAARRGLQRVERRDRWRWSPMGSARYSLPWHVDR